MSIYKKASKLKLRFNTTKGSLSVEQLWDLPIDQLDALAVSINNELEKSSSKSFLVKRANVDSIDMLRLDIAVNILTEKVDELEAAKEATLTKRHNAKIDDIIARKQEAELESMTLEQLEALRK